MSKLLFAYVLLDRENGWKLITKIIDEKASPFLLHYAALQITRNLYEERKDLVDQKKCLGAITSIMEVKYLADFAVEDLRKWERWEYCEVILKLPSKPGFDSPVMRKSVLRFALQCPTPSAKNYVNAERGRDPEFVTDTEELLDLERKPSAPSNK